MNILTTLNKSQKNRLSSITVVLTQKIFLIQKKIIQIKFGILLKKILRTITTSMFKVI